MKRPYVLCLLLWLTVSAALAQTPTPVEADWTTAAATGDLPEAALLAIGVVEMETGISPGNSADPQASLRAAEARYLPFLLRQVLQETQRWGPVRMLPGRDQSVELLVSGTIIESSGDRLSVHFLASDSTGRHWLDRQYQASAQRENYRHADQTDPFHSLYREVAADLDRYRATLSLDQLRYIIEVARLKYAAALAPDAFAGYLQRGPDGRFQIRRLPAADDPIMARVERIRDREYLFIDTVDLRYDQYVRELRPTYTAWRESVAESGALMDSYRRNAGSRKGKDSARSRYLRLRELKLYQQSLRETLASFSFAATPTSVELDGELVQLSGSMSEQQQQWKALLSRIYVSEVGLPAASHGPE